MPTLSVSQFKAKCLSLLDNLGPEGIILTRHGKPVARVLPEGPGGASLIGSLKGEIRIKGNLHSTGVRWNAQS
jgi:antitoxin (DNA-binding transcriptional repressor) of toxin-antitoxin stability system